MSILLNVFIRADQYDIFPQFDIFAIALLHDQEELNSIPKHLYLGTFSRGFPLYRNTDLHLCPLPLNLMALVFSILTSIRHFLQYSPNLFKRICSSDSDLDIKTNSGADM